MGKLVTPKVYLTGYTTLDHQGLVQYLKDTNNEDFLWSVESARGDGLSDGEILTSFYAKLCYASLTLGKNKNLSRTRDIPDNLKGCFDQGHGSVFEHVVINFVVHNCSRVYTHEQVRHRVGTAYSQTSGRYVRGDEVNIVFDPILEPVRFMLEEGQRYLENLYQDMCTAMGLNGREALRRFASVPRDNPWAGMVEPKDSQLNDYARNKLGIEDLDNPPMDLKKKITSALRRILPNGQSNEMGMSLNLRTIRHTVMVRTSRHAEWEIREIYSQIYYLLKERFPLLFYKAKEEVVNGIIEVSGMKLQPYEKE